MKDIRRLIYVPILHAQEDARRSDALLTRRNRLLKRNVKIEPQPSPVEQMWKGIATKVAGLNLPWQRTRIYQDGVPVCGNELELAKRLAESGSPNFSFVLDLVEKGATLEGTEDLDLLIQEYDLLNNLLMIESEAERPAASAQYQKNSRALLESRDQFISARINSTLQVDEVPIVFMGVMHRLDKLLERHFLVSYVIYRLPFRSVGAIYNA
jgi:hypothetical protein